MRSSKIIAGASAGVLLALSGGAQALTAATTFNVTATVAPLCTVNANNLPFGAFTGTQIDVTSVIGVSCTAQTGYTIALNVGSAGGSFAQREMDNAGTGVLLYSLFTNNTYGTVWGDGTASTGTVAGTGTGLANTVNHSVFGRLFATGNENAQSGSYSSTINVTVTYN